MSTLGEEEYYEDADLWKRERYLNNEAELRRFGTCVDLVMGRGKSLLDIGTGNGAFLSILEGHGADMELAGLERSKSAVQHAVCRTPIHLGLAEHLPFDDRSFSIVSALEVLEHLPRGIFQQVLHETERVAGDYILVSVPYNEQRVNVVCPYCGCQFHPYYHMRAFNEATIEGLFSEFRLEELVLVSQAEFRFGALLRCIAAANKDWINPSGLCPQCGYRDDAESSTKAAATSGVTTRIRELAASLLPKKHQPRWAVARFVRL